MDSKNCCTSAISFVNSCGIRLNSKTGKAECLRMFFIKVGMYFQKCQLFYLESFPTAEYATHSNLGSCKDKCHLVLKLHQVAGLVHDVIADLPPCIR